MYPRMAFECGCIRSTSIQRLQVFFSHPVHLRSLRVGAVSSCVITACHVMALSKSAFNGWSEGCIAWPGKCIWGGYWWKSYTSPIHVQILAFPLGTLGSDLQCEQFCSFGIRITKRWGFFLFVLFFNLSINDEGYRCFCFLIESQFADNPVSSGN